MDREFSLYELNIMIGGAIKEAFPTQYKVTAEISELNNHSSGHCYLELVQKNEAGQTVAKARGMIWASTYRQLRPYFEQTTGQQFRAGIKVLVTVSVTFHPMFHYSLNITDIDPTFTIGDMARRRAEIIKQLTAEGVIDDNKKLEWSDTPRRIAVISSATAAGYGDFINQLHNNAQGFKLYTSLFATIMQGDQSETSVIKSLDRVFENADCFDCVVIIRGGGATSELNCFDSYKLAQHITQFPIPVVVGIGHERDETVLDYVANTRVKTPTAAAEMLIGRMQIARDRGNEIKDAIASAVNNRLSFEGERLNVYKERIPNYISNTLNREMKSLLTTSNRLSYTTGQIITRESVKLSPIASIIKSALQRNIEREEAKLNLIKSKIELTSPESILKRGYSLTVKDGVVIKGVNDISQGDSISIIFADGEKSATID